MEKYLFYLFVTKLNFIIKYKYKIKNKIKNDYLRDLKKEKIQKIKIILFNF